MCAPRKNAHKKKALFTGIVSLTQGQELVKHYFILYNNKEARSRSEQPGWTGARARNQAAARLFQGRDVGKTGVVSRRSVTVRSAEPQRAARMDRSEGARDQAAAKKEERNRKDRVRP